MSTQQEQSHNRPIEVTSILFLSMCVRLSIYACKGCRGPWKSKGHWPPGAGATGDYEPLA